MIWDEANTPRYHPYYTAQKGNVTLRPVTGPAVSAFHAAAPRWLVSVLWESLQPKAFLSKGKTGGHWSFQRIVTNIIINTADEKCQWENCENRRKRRLSKDSYGFGRLKKYRLLRRICVLPRTGWTAPLSCCYTNLIIKRRKRPG